MKSNAVVVTDIQGDFTLFLMKLTHQYKTFEKQKYYYWFIDSQN
jgi:hypothetical protein